MVLLYSSITYTILSASGYSIYKNNIFPPTTPDTLIFRTVGVDLQ